MGAPKTAIFTQLVHFYPDAVGHITIGGDNFLYQLTETLERHYGGLLINRVHQLQSSCPPHPPSPATDDPPF